ncbi:hypothetical protein DFO68_11937, partial [Halomonas ventosae]
RPGKRQALWTQTVSIHDDNKTEYVVQRVMRLVERTAMPVKLVGTWNQAASNR